MVVTGSLKQTKFLSPAHGRSAVVHPELEVNVIGVGTQGG
jgi:hypothetical protein